MSHKIFYEIALWLTRTYSKLTMKVDIQWQSSLPRGGVLLVSNHPSGTDAFMIHLASPQQVSVLISAKAFTVPIFGHYLRKIRQIPAVRGQNVIENLREMLQSGETVAIFPEGDFSPGDGGIQKLHSGAARLALATGVPVIPVGIAVCKGWRYAITSHVEGKPTLGYWYLHGPYTMTIGKSLIFKGDESDRAQVEATTKEIERHILALTTESEARLNSKPLSRLEAATQTVLKSIYTFVLSLFASGAM